MQKNKLFLLGAIVFTLLLVGVYAYGQKSNPGHPWSGIDCDGVMCVDTANNKITMGTVLSNGANVGIGTTNPEHKVHIESGNLYVNNNSGGIRTNGSITGKIFYDDDDTNYYIDPTGNSKLKGSLYFYNSENKECGRIWSDSSEELKMSNNTGYGFITIKGNKIGINHQEPSATLHVSGLVLASGYRVWSNFYAESKHLHFYTSTKEDAYATLHARAYAVGSSIKFKKDISVLSKKDYQKIVHEIKNVNLYSYRLKSDDNKVPKTIGVIAEKSPKDFSDGKFISLEKYVNYLAGGLKGTIIQAETQEKAIKTQEERIRTLEEELKRIRNLISN